MKMIFVLFIVLLFFSLPLHADDYTSNQMKIESEGFIFQSYRSEGRVFRNSDEMEHTLGMINDVHVNNSVHYSEVFSSLAIPPAIGGACIVGWGLRGIAQGNYRLDPILYGAGFGMIGVSLILKLISNSEMNSAIKHYNSVVENGTSIHLDNYNSSIRLCISMNF